MNDSFNCQVKLSQLTLASTGRYRCEVIFKSIFQLYQKIWVLGKSGPGELGPGQLGPGQLGPGQLGPRHVYYP